MKVDISYSVALDRHPALVREITDILNARLSRAKIPAAEASGIKWSYEWSVRLTGGAAIENCHICLQGAIGRRSAAVGLQPGLPIPKTPSDQVPPEVIQFYDEVNKTVDPAKTPHVAQFKYKDFRGRTKQGLVFSGYKDRKGNQFILTKTAHERDSGLEILLKVTGNILTWSGGLRELAEERLYRTAEGDEFSWKNKKLTRLTVQEIHTLIGAGPFTLQL